MMSRSWPTPALFAVLLAGCITPHADHFYSLQPLPNQDYDPRRDFTTQVHLSVFIPSAIDRNELVLNTPGRVVVLEHERWASPLADQMTAVLGQDIEQRRNDSLVVSRHLTRQALPTISIAVDIVAVEIEKGGQARLEARWRLQREGADATQGRETFSSPMGADYAEVAHALSSCIAALADRLAAEWPAQAAP